MADTDYHSPNDQVKPDWDWTGPKTMAELGMVIGLRVANADTMPAWLPTSRFNKPRTPAKVTPWRFLCGLSYA